MQQEVGRVVLITGATSGIGLAAGKHLAGAGDRVVLHARNAERAEEVLAEARKEVPAGRFETVTADLSVGAEVAALAAEIKARWSRLDVLVLNAGLYNRHRRETQEGIEETFMVNHLSQFLLLEDLMPSLQRMPGLRILIVASQAHHSAQLDLEDVEMRNRRYKGWLQYSNTKLMNLLLTRALVDRLEGTGVTVNAMHPGIVATGIVRRDWRARLLFRVFGLPSERGAGELVRLATTEDGERFTGQYFVEGKRRHPRRAAQSDELAERLWSLSAAYADRLRGTG